MSSTSTTQQPTLRQLVAAPVEIKVGAGSIKVQPMGWFLGSEAIELLFPAIDTMPVRADGETDDQFHNRWILFVIEARDHVSAFCAAASGQPEEDVRELQPPLLVDLMLGVLEVNADFFVQSLPVLAARVAGRIAAVKERFEAALAALTDPASTSSSSA